MTLVEFAGLDAAGARALGTVTAAGVLGVLIVCGVRDFLTERIPNRLNAVLFLGVLGHTAAVVPVPYLLTHAAVAGLVGAAAVGAFALRLFGGGDAKMLMALGPLLDLQGAMLFAVLVGLSGGVYVAALLVIRWWKPGFGLIEAHFGALPAGLQPRRTVPYGVPLAFAAAICLLYASPGSGL